MHSQILVIHPLNVDLETVMYPYQEIDKYQWEKIKDDRCMFFLTVSEKEIPNLLSMIKKYLESRVQFQLERLHYRCEHSLQETDEKFGNKSMKYVFELYKTYTDKLSMYEKVKDLCFDDPRQIKFVLDNGFDAMDKNIDIYIKGKGYGTFHNPYELWDYYTPVHKRGFHRPFLIREHGQSDNIVGLKELDVEKTVKNILELSSVWEHIIFYDNESCESRLYTIDDIRFNEDWNNHCLLENMDGVTDLVDVLSNLKEEYGGDVEAKYVVVALDSHW